METSTTSKGSVEGSGYRKLVIQRPAGFKPSHPLDVPPRLSTYAEGGFRPGEFLSEAEALAEVREYNLRELTRGGNTWAICLEIGEPLDEPALSSIDLVDGAGLEERGVAHPVRVVTPRAEPVTV